MAGIKIHQYPLERTSIGDDDYYDIDYWTGSSYQTAKIKGSTLKNVLGANYIDITAFISGYELTDKDAGKLITNSNANVRTLVITSGLALPNNMVTVKGRIAIQPETGVNITLPDGSTITDPSQFTCVADEVYILHKSAFSGDNYILVPVKKSENIGTNDLIITDTVRELQVAENGTFQIVTNDANNSAIFKVGENSNERFSEIELNSITYDVTTAEPNPTNNGAGVITRINPNEYEIESRSDIGNSATKRSRIYTSPNEVILEKTNAGKLTLNSLGASNTFEDLRATKKGLEYFADYSANFSVRSLVDKGYVDTGLNAKQDTLVSGVNIRTINGESLLGSTDISISGTDYYDGVDVSPLPQRGKLRALEYIELVDNPISEETEIQLRADSIKDAETTRFGENGSGNVDLKISQNKIITGDVNNFAEEYTASSECILGLDASSQILEFEAVEIYNILKEEGVTANKQLVLLDINGNSANVKAKFEISAIAVQNTTANAVTINVGSTALGTDVVNAYALGASETKKLPLGTTFFSILTGQNLFISSGSWNSASLNIHVTISKIWQ